MDVEAQFLQARRLHQAGRLEDAEAIYQTILREDPRHAGALAQWGALALQRGQTGEGVARIDAALRVDPGQPAAHLMRANALAALGRYLDAVEGYDRALALDPTLTHAQIFRANALGALNRLEEAVLGYDRALARDPGNAMALANRALALFHLGRAEEALAGCQLAIAAQPNQAYPHAILGEIFAALDRREDALASLDRAAALDPRRAMIHIHRAGVLRASARLPEAVEAYERALSLNGAFPYVRGDWLMAKLLCCDWRALDLGAQAILRDIDAGMRASTPFPLLMIESSPSQQLKAAQMFIADRFGSIVPAKFAARRDRDKITIGYFSSDFFNHATAYLMAHMLELHDRAAFEIVGFTYGPVRDDAMARRVADAFDAFIDVAALTDSAAAARAREQGIDIAIDLKGFSEHGRTGIFAHRAAPVQVSFLGYPGTMGAGFIDYLIADKVVAPPEARGHFSEKIVCLPHTYQVNDSTRTRPDPRFSRAELGLPEEGVVFASFNASAKLTPAQFDIWMRLLKATDGSVLWLFQDNASVPSPLRREAVQRGVAGERLVFAPRLDLEAHLARHHCADLFLDSFPYTAHTTASDALWMGVPVITRQGDVFASRVAASLLHAMDAGELVTRTGADYEALALDLARTPERRAALRAKLTANRHTHPLFDTARFTRHIEGAYRQMWARHQAGQRPDHFSVEARP